MGSRALMVGPGSGGEPYERPSGDHFAELSETEGFVEGLLFMLLVSDEDVLTHRAERGEGLADKLSTHTLPAGIGVHEYVLEVADCRAVADDSRQSDE